MARYESHVSVADISDENENNGDLDKREAQVR